VVENTVNVGAIRARESGLLDVALGIPVKLYPTDIMFDELDAVSPVISVWVL